MMTEHENPNRHSPYLGYTVRFPCSKTSGRRKPLNISGGLSEHEICPTYELAISARTLEANFVFSRRVEKIERLAPSRE